MIGLTPGIYNPSKPRSSIVPVTNDIFNIGSLTKQFHNGYFAGTLFLSGSNAKIYQPSADTNAITVAGGSDATSSTGAYVKMFGNTNASTGKLELYSGNASGAFCEYAAKHGSGRHAFLIASNEILRFESTGNILFHASNGGNLIISRNSMGVMVGATSVHSDLTAFGNSPNIFLSGDSSSRGHLVCVGSGNTNTGTLFYLFKSRATDGSADTIVQNNDQVFNFSGWAADGASYRNVGGMIVRVDGTPGSNDVPSSLELRVRAAGAGADAVCLKLRASRWLEIPNTAGAPGTNPGSGGYLYTESGALKYRGSSGTVTTIANA